MAGMTCVVIDDSAEVRYILNQQLTRILGVDWEIFTPDSYEAAGKLLERQENVDLVFLDGSLTKWGRELTWKSLAGSVEGCLAWHGVIVCFSGDGEAIYQEMLTSFGGFGVRLLGKPARKGELRELLVDLGLVEAEG